MFHLIGFIVFGFIVGLIARALTPGHKHMGILATSLLGIAGSLIAGYLGRSFGWYGPDDGAGFISSTVGAIVLIALYHMIARRSSGVSAVKDKDFPRRVA